MITLMLGGVGCGVALQVVGWSAVVRVVYKVDATKAVGQSQVVLPVTSCEHSCVRGCNKGVLVRVE